MRFRFRHLAAFTVGTTYVLMLLGVYTAGTATGLSCGAQWPVCGGGPFGLFPPNLASVAEWAHRFVAMVGGFAILGTAAAAWRGDDRPTRAATLLAVALLPLQVAIGAVTVTFGGLLPGGFSPPVQLSHFVVALTIFTLLAWVLVRAYEADDALPADAEVRAALAALALAPFVVAFSRDTLFTYTGAVVAASYAAGLAAFLALLVVALRATGRLGRLATATLGVLVVQMLFGRDLLLFTGWVPLAYLAVTALFAVGVAAVAWTATRGNRTRARAASTSD
jgi:cytochrome c oxidase assembly protein subunit 15